MSLSAKQISAGYGETNVLSDVSLECAPGQITAIIGPNGSGKSTLLSVLAGLTAPKSGQAELNGQPLANWKRRALAKELAILPQMPSAPTDMKVWDLVSHGRFAHRPLLAPIGADDRAIIAEALFQTGTDTLAKRPFGALSGGERQRVWIAMALTQKPRWLLLDEPTSHLDFGHQYQILHLIAQISRNAGIGTIAVLHDIQHAGRFADRIVALSDGLIVADGAPQAVITEDLIAHLYGLSADISWHGVGQERQPVLIPRLSSAKTVSKSDKTSLRENSKPASTA